MASRDEQQHEMDVTKEILQVLARRLTQLRAEVNDGLARKETMKLADLLDRAIRQCDTIRETLPVHWTEHPDGWFRPSLSRDAHWFRQGQMAALCGVHRTMFASARQNQTSLTAIHGCRVCSRLLELGTQGAPRV